MSTVDIWLYCPSSRVTTRSCRDPLSTFLYTAVVKSKVAEATSVQLKTCQAVFMLAGPAAHHPSKLHPQYQTLEQMMLCGRLQCRSGCIDNKIWPLYVLFGHQTNSYICIYWFLSINSILWCKSYITQYLTYKQLLLNCSIPCQAPLSQEIVYHHSTRAHAKRSEEEYWLIQCRIFTVKNKYKIVAVIRYNTESSPFQHNKELSGDVKNIFLVYGVEQY